MRRGFSAWALASAVAAMSVSVPLAAQARQAFRVSSLKIVDPQIFVDVFGTGGCNNITNPPGLLNISVNGLVQDFIDECEPVTAGVAEPCSQDFNLLAIFDPLDQQAAAGAPLTPCTDGGPPCSLSIGLDSECIRNGDSVSCSGDLENAVSTTYSTGGAGTVCLDAYAGTSGPNNTGNYNPGIVPTDGPCAVSNTVDLTLELGTDLVITIPLQDLQLAGQFVEDPATGLTKGLARGFLSETAADNITIDVTDPIQLSIILSEVLPGGTNSCAPRGRLDNTQDDRDRNPPNDPNGERGWWFYLSLEAEAVDVPEPPTPTPTATPDAPTPTPTPFIPECAGDCNENGSVTIGELQKAINVFLGLQPLSSCRSADADANSSVSAGDLVQSVNSFRLGCP